MNLSGKKCTGCQKVFLEESGLWPKSVAVYSVRTIKYFVHIGCLPKCYICNNDPADGYLVPPFHVSAFEIWGKTKRKANVISATAQYLAFGPEYKLINRPQYKLGKDLHKPKIDSSSTNKQYVCYSCIMMDNNSKIQTDRELEKQTNKIRKEEEKKAAQIKQEAINEKARIAAKLVEDAARIKKEKEELQIRTAKEKIDREKESDSLIASGIDRSLVSLYVEGKLPKQILLLIFSIFEETQDREELVLALISLLRQPNSITNTEWSNTNYWKQQFGLLKQLVDFCDSSGLKSVSLIKVISCVINVHYQPSQVLIFVDESLKRIVQIKEWLENPETEIIFEGIFSEPQKITYDGALKLLEDGFEGKPEALMEVIEGGKNWEVVAIKYGFYQL